MSDAPLPEMSQLHSSVLVRLRYYKVRVKVESCESATKLLKICKISAASMGYSSVCHSADLLVAEISLKEIWNSLPQ